MTRGNFHRSFPMGDTSRIGEARRHAASLAHDLQWGELMAGKLSIVVTELASNLVRHATGGRLLITASPARSEVEMICIDEGPGMQDVERSFSDGYSTGGTPGTGLGAVRRLASDFDIHSVPGQGTVAVARLRERPLEAAGLRVGAICVALEGEAVSGDGWAAFVDGKRASAMVADGLGHGEGAAKASDAALAIFSEDPFGDTRRTLESAHQELRTTRGAAVFSLQADAEAGTLRSSGAGNVMARIISGVYDKSIVTQHGTVGLQVRRFDETQNAWPDHAMVIVHTDGITSRWSPDVVYPVLGRDPALAAALVLRAHSRGRDDATVVVVARSA